MTLARLVFRLQPFSIGFAPFVCLVLAGASLWLASDMRAVLEACGTPDEPKACQVTYAFQDTHMNAVYLTQTGISLAMYGIPALLPQEVFFGVAASRYPEVLVRESAAILGATVMVGALAGFVVHRRRPE